MQITAKELCILLEGELEGNGETVVSNLAKIETATQDDISFIAQPKYEQYAHTTGAGVLIVAKTFRSEQPVKATLIRVDDPYQSFTKLLNLQASMQQTSLSGVEQPAFIGGGVVLPQDIYVGAFSYIGKGAKIGNGTKIHPQVYIGEHAVIGEHCIIYPGARIMHDCRIGNHCIIHPGAVIGSDGFGFAPNADGTYTKIPQTGNVILEDYVEIGANTTIDRATLGATVIKRGVKLDNLIQVGHNVEIGENTAMAAQVGIAGSTKIGKNVMVAGQVGFAGHLNIADGSKFQAQAGVPQSVEKPNAAWGGTPAIDVRQYIKSLVIFRNLPEMERRLREIEQQLKG
ncbi:MAG: UDP-3-O-(3-hydroxymyristoyl)glucosamine N-acyltransferase [Chitinophagales bacterium]|nr:UDP-3-O-(3-hydroxymyristoyl)glucosamine N-acyltransferase [Chitinophagales bacterium]